MTDEAAKRVEQDVLGNPHLEKRNKDVLGEPRIQERMMGPRRRDDLSEDRFPLQAFSILWNRSWR